MSTAAALGVAVTMSSFLRPIATANAAAHLARCTRHARALAFVLLAATMPVAAAAQSAELKRATASRAELEALAASASASEAEAIRTRLRDGDFQVGDRVVLVVTRPDSTRTDTLAVREGRALELPGLFTASLQGVLRSELQPRLASEVARVIREPRVQARTLVRVAVLGEVARPGFYWMTADALVSDAIMTAGGPTSLSDPAKSVIRRGTEELWDRSDVAEAIRAGLTLDQLMVRAGDELVIGRKSVRDSESTLRVVTTVVGLIVSVIGVVVLASR